MYPHNRLFALIFRIIFLFFCGMGLYLNSGIPHGEFAFYMLIFYTIQSNILCFIYFLVLVSKNIYDIKSGGIRGSSFIFPHFKGAVTMTIAVTFIVYHFILAPVFLSELPDYSILNLQNLTVHYIVPIMAIADWLLFDKKQIFRWFDPLLWLSVPLSYFCFLLIRAKAGGIIAIVKSSYPYFFIDVDLLGWMNVLKNAGYLTSGFLMLGYFIYIIDKINIKIPSTHFNTYTTYENGAIDPL